MSLFGIFKSGKKDKASKKQGTKNPTAKKDTENVEIKLPKEEYITEVCSKTGWSRERTIDSMQKAKDAGVSNIQYVRKKCYTLDESDFEELGEVLRKAREFRKENYRFYKEIAAKRSGLDPEELEEQMQQAKKLGISHLKYVQFACWNKDDEELAAFGEECKEKLVSIKDNKQEYVKKVCDATGWSEGKAELEINKARVSCGASYEDYAAFRLYEVDEAEWTDYVTHNLFVKMRLKYNDHVNGWKIFDDKIAFNKTFSDLMSRVWFGNDDLTYDSFAEKTADLKAIIVKPLRLTQGKGIRKFECNVSDEEKRRNYDEIMNMGDVIIEEYIIQNEDVMKFSPSSVNTLRMMTLNYNNECRFLCSVFRIGGDKAVVDNFHAGGIAASVDVETGIVYTNAVDLEGNVYETSPATGEVVKGYQIPHWDKIREACKAAIGRVEGVDLIGWDFAITQDGVELIEGNPGASYIVSQLPNIEDRSGLRAALVDPYLNVNSNSSLQK